VRILATINQKGGVGKTTTAVNLGAALASLGKRVLFVDLDPQAHLPYSLCLMAHALDRSILDALRQTRSLESLIQKAGGFSIVPSSPALSDLEREFAVGAEREFAVGESREFMFKKALAPVKDYDFVLVDCPPNLGLLTLNALSAVTELLAPVQPEFLALQSLGMLMRTVEAVKKSFNPGLAVSGVLLTRYQRSKKLNREIRKSISIHFGELLLETVIRDNISLAEAPSFGMDVLRYKPSSNGAADYLSLARELLQRGAP